MKDTREALRKALESVVELQRSAVNDFLTKGEEREETPTNNWQLSWEEICLLAGVHPGDVGAQVLYEKIQAQSDSKVYVQSTKDHEDAQKWRAIRSIVAEDALDHAWELFEAIRREGEDNAEFEHETEIVSKARRWDELCSYVEDSVPASSTAVFNAIREEGRHEGKAESDDSKVYVENTQDRVDAQKWREVTDFSNIPETSSASEVRNALMGDCPDLFKRESFKYPLSASDVEESHVNSLFEDRLGRWWKRELSGIVRWDEVSHDWSTYRQDIDFVATTYGPLRFADYRSES